MIDVACDPLNAYRDSLRERFAELTRQKFRDLLGKSGLDTRANRKLVSDVRALEGRISEESKKYAYFLIPCLLFFAGGVGCAVYAYCAKLQSGALAGAVIGCMALLIFGVVAAVKAFELYGLIGKLKKQKAKKIDEAYRQMSPLNTLYTWDIPVRLIEKAFPDIKFDPYVTDERLADLTRFFGWDDSFNAGKSVLFAQSGLVNANPFIFGEFMQTSWGEKTYVGRKTITWLESTVGPDGKSRTVSRIQTLSASVTKPCPVYTKEKILIYGNSAAPNLNFSRCPSGLANAEDGFFTNLKKRNVLRDLQKYSENLDDDSNFTLMANHEFETLFHAKDRDNEVEFRLLFTSLAQEQMLNLMKDDCIGYGDDFSFIKRGKINVLCSKHLSDTPLTTDPSIFHDWDFDNAHLKFRNINEDYFKNIYFSLAPLLAIPLYQQTGTYKDCGLDGAPGASSFWEHEAIANHYGDEYFKHPSCITKNILKTKLVSRHGNYAKICVTASGFKGEKHVDYETVLGRDGRYHKVPVEWIEYLPVERNTYMLIGENAERSDCYGMQHSVCRRNIYAYI